MTDLGLRATSAVGFVTMIAIAWVFSQDRKRIAWKTVAWGVGLQFVLALVLLKSEPGRNFFAGANNVVNRLISYSETGATMVFGPRLMEVDDGSFVLHVLPPIIFMGSLFSILYHLGIIQRIVSFFAAGLTRTMGLSGAESLAAISNVFVGMVESALVVKPYLPRMTHSELFAMMTLGMGTVAGGVLIAYVTMLGGGDFAGHLVIASLLSAPAGILIAKIIIPEVGIPETRGGADAFYDQGTSNVIDAAVEGGLGGLRLAAYVGALLIAFIALVAMMNDLIGWVGGWFGHPEVTFQMLLGFVLMPLALVMGIPWEDANAFGGLLGIKTILNEFLAYQELGKLAASGELQPRTVVIASYALCGFANFGSLAILLGGIGGIAPERRHEIAKLGLYSILSGSLTTFMTACIAGVLL